ncbi:MAG TPA: hypothetical protein VI589_01020, partial [Vicinamibacteria bacterium]
MAVGDVASVRARGRSVSRGPSPFGWGLRLLYLVSFAVIGLLFWRGASFYATPVGERAHHEGYWHWKAGGSIGLLLGVVGAGMMVVLLLYSVRKRVKGLRRAGPIARWLDIHIYLGVVGPLLIILHTAFKVGGLVALSFWSMIAVALSGVLGRFLYIHIPRTRAGEELSLAELQRADVALSARLQGEFGLSPTLMGRLQALATPPERRGLIVGLTLLAFDDLRLRGRLRAFARLCRSVPPDLYREFEDVVRQKALAQRRIQLWERLHAAFHYWHVIH